MGRGGRNGGAATGAGAGECGVCRDGATGAIVAVEASHVEGYLNVWCIRKLKQLAIVEFALFFGRNSPSHAPRGLTVRSSGRRSALLQPVGVVLGAAQLFVRAHQPCGY